MESVNSILSAEHIICFTRVKHVKTLSAVPKVKKYHCIWTKARFMDWSVLDHIGVKLLFVPSSKHLFSHDDENELMYIFPTC